jgi:hypothetical protein
MVPQVSVRAARITTHYAPTEANRQDANNRPRPGPGTWKTELEASPSTPSRQPTDRASASRRIQIRMYVKRASTAGITRDCLDIVELEAVLGALQELQDV